MNRAEFLAALGAELQDVTAEEREEALKFYNEYLDEAGPENEAAVLRELGSPHKVACIIRANCGSGAPDARGAARKNAGSARAPGSGAPGLTLEGPAWRAAAPQAGGAGAEEPARETAFAAQADAPCGEQNAPGGERNAPGGGPRYASAGARPHTDGGNRALWVVLLIVTSPIWIGILGGLVGVVFGILGGLFGLVAGGAVTIAAGIAAFAGGVGLLFTSVPSGLLMTGLSLLCIGAGALLCGGTVWLAGKAGPALWRAVSAFCRTLFGKVR